ncbi:rCG51868 [Rattus norvegicus]|nr:rCG51868 [Rattus norvegicus]
MLPCCYRSITYKEQEDLTLRPHCCLPCSCLPYSCLPCS